MKQQKQVKTILSKKASLLLEELWENATFNTQTYNLINKVAVKCGDGDNSKQISDFQPLLEEACFTLSTVRNRNLISDKQQELLRQIVVGVFGLSVGSHASLTWMMQSRANAIKIADPDTISPSNLNRLRFGWKDVGEYKTEVVKKQLLEINPFAKVITSISSDTKKTLKTFDDKSPLDIIIDAMDDLQGKILIRKYAKEKKIPLLMATDVGDNIFLDVERYDLDPQPQIFLGVVPNIEDIDLSQISDLERKRMVIKIIGFQENSEEMLDSLYLIGKKLLTWPQLGATATIAGGVIVTTIKKIVLGEKVLSGRYYISLDDILVKDFKVSARCNVRSKKIGQLKKKFKV